MTGSLRGGSWSGSRNLDDHKDIGSAAIWLKAIPKAGDVSLHAEGWVIDQGVFETNDTKSVLREGYVEWNAGPLDIRVGRQIVVWGRADQINPTDNLTPRDYTLLFTDDNDQRIGATALKASTYFNDISLQAVWIPYFRPNTIPIAPIPPPLNLVITEPDSALGQWGVKIEKTGGAFDGSISYFDGFDLNPDASLDVIFVQSNQPPILNLKFSYHRIRVIGIDGATTVGKYGLRGEAAYTFTENGDGTDPYVKNPFFFMVLGSDRTFYENLNINLQYIFRMIDKYSDPMNAPTPQMVVVEEALLSNQLDQTSHGMSYRIGDKWLNDTLEAEVAGIYMFTRHDYMVRPKIAYAFTDHVKGLVAAEIFRGPDLSFFGYLWGNSKVFTELSYFF
ncbi:MAG TPA: DUF1302 family protein [Nitrospiria bacterium]|nr:DUF1302 family protein [Nitrospiria bacterium]